MTLNRSLHTQTHRTAPRTPHPPHPPHPHPTARPRWERDEEMEQPEGGGPKHVWEGSVVRHTAGRFSLSGTAPPL